MAEKLSIVLGKHGQVEDLRSGEVKVEGVDLEFVEVARMPDAYRDMARTQPYCISELAPTTYLMALAAGAPLTAFPIPMTRRFRHRGILRPVNGRVKSPRDLPGKAFGVRTYTVTAAVWTRGILADDYGFNPDSVTWVTQEEDNVAGFVPPPNVKRLPKGESFVSLMKRGDLDMALAGLAGLDETSGIELVELVENAAEREMEWYARTGIYPIHGLIAVRNDVIASVPDIGMRLWQAFIAAKASYWSRIESREAAGKEGQRYRKLVQIVGDPLPYGLEENRRALEALLRYAHTQQLISRAPDIGSLFPDPRETAPGTIAVWS